MLQLADAAGFLEEGVEYHGIHFGVDMQDLKTAKTGLKVQKQLLEPFKEIRGPQLSLHLTGPVDSAYSTELFNAWVMGSSRSVGSSL